LTGWGRKEVQRWSSQVLKIRNRKNLKSDQQWSIADTRCFGVERDFHSHKFGKTKAKSHLDDVLNEHITSLK
jgi:hypothetical protein